MVGLNLNFIYGLLASKAQAGIEKGNDVGRCRLEPNLKTQSRHLLGVTEENPWKNLSGWSVGGIEPTTS